MRNVIYAINTTLDGCVDHTKFNPDEETMEYFTHLTRNADRHKHDHDDEFFFCLQGQFFIDLEGSKIELNSNQGVTIPKGVMHRPRAPKKTVILMVETSEIVPTGD